MTWFKVDDSLGFHAKTIAAGNPAMGLWVRAGSWCSQQLTDGVVPRHVALTLGTSAQAKALVLAGLWFVNDDEGVYSFHEWDRYQPSAAEARADQAKKHEKKVDAGRLGGIASGIARRKHEGSSLEANEEANGKQNEAPTRPDPTIEEKNGADAPAPTRSDVEGLCRYLLTAVTRNDVRASITARWRTEARLMLDRDKRDPSEIRAVIDWATTDSFWRANIHSVPKLREKYDQLRLQMSKGSRQLPDGDNREYLREWS